MFVSRNEYDTLLKCYVYIYTEVRNSISKKNFPPLLLPTDSGKYTKYAVILRICHTVTQIVHFPKLKCHVCHGVIKTISGPGSN